MADAQALMAYRAENNALEADKERECQEPIEAFEKVRSAVQSGDVNALRAAFDGRNGLILGRLTKNGRLERMMLLEMMKAPDAPLELLRVFFRDLGGRLWPNPYKKPGVHVYSLLIDIDYDFRYQEIASEHEVGRWTERLAKIVDFFAEVNPVPCGSHFSMISRSIYPRGTLIQLAWNNEAYAAWTALKKHVRVLEGQTAYNMIDRKALRRGTGVNAYSSFWFKRFVPDVTNDALEMVMSRYEMESREQEFAFRPLMNAEVERRKEVCVRVCTEFERLAKERKFPEEVVKKITTMACSGFPF
jgi:hypothetical protein